MDESHDDCTAAAVPALLFSLPMQPVLEDTESMETFRQIE